MAESRRRVSLEEGRVGPRDPVTTLVSEPG